MPNASGELELPVGVFLILRDLIRERMGAWFEDQKRELLASKLTDRVRGSGAASFLDYYYLLKYGKDAEAEWDEVADVLSVQETYFWREIDQVRVLVDILLPQCVAADRAPLRIWCAACASGEEPLTIAMALQEAGWFERAEIQILASDASPSALEKARGGVYRPRSFRALPAALRDRYFTPVEDCWRVRPELHSRIQYRRANLLSQAEIAPLAAARFVFCRNVFIYFSTETIRAVVAGFGRRMPRPGYLFVGISESLLRVSTEFSLEEIGGSFVYVKR
jgi:chemotaxis protein methyltransferase CheR